MKKFLLVIFCCFVLFLPVQAKNEMDSILFSGMLLAGCAYGRKPNAPDQSEKQIRLIALASPFSKPHWMLTKARVNKDYTAQDVLEMIEDLKPDCLERFITGYIDRNELGFTYVYAIIQDSWDAHTSVTSKDGPYKGKTMYDITKELLNNTK